MLKRLTLALILTGTVAASSAITFPQQKAARGEGATDKQTSKLSEEQEQSLVTVKQVAASASASADRVRGSLLEAQAADLLWPFDELQAWSHFQHALEVIGRLEPDRNASKLERAKFLFRLQRNKEEILKLFSRRDSKAVEELAKKVRPEEKESAESSYKEQTETAENLVQMGRGVVKDDPKKALELGLKSIKDGQFAQEFVVLFAELYAQDREAGRQLLMSGIDRLTKPGGDVLSGLNALRGFTSDPRVWDVDPALREAAVRLLEIYSQRLTEIANLIRQGQYVSKELASGLIRLAQPGFIQMLQAINPDRLPEMQQLLSELSAQLDARDRKVAALKSIFDGQYESFDSELVKIEGERDTAVRDLAFRALALSAVKRKEYENARRATEKIQEIDLRLETRDDINFRQATREAQNQNLDEAVRRARDITDMLLRTQVLIWVAAGATKDEALIRSVLDQAYSSAQQAEVSPEKAQALVKVADAYAQFNVPHAFEIYFASTQILNKLGLSQLPTKKQPQQRLITFSMSLYTSDGDRIAKEEVPSLEDINFGRGLERLGQEDYQQAMLLANSVKHDILRARMQLAVCRGVLGKKPTDKEIQKQ